MDAVEVADSQPHILGQRYRAVPPSENRRPESNQSATSQARYNGFRATVVTGGPLPSDRQLRNVPGLVRQTIATSRSVR